MPFRLRGSIARRRDVPILGVWGCSDNAARCRSCRRAPAMDYGTALGVSDLVGTPTELVDETGKVAWSARSTSWGITAWKPGGSAYTPLRCPGQYEDPETGLRDNFFRHYDPETGRYVTPDPLGIAPAPNSLTYVHNPYTFCDPLGLTPCPQFKGLGWLTEKQIGRPSFRHQRTVTHQDYEQQ